MTGGPRARLREITRLLRLAAQYELRLLAQRKPVDPDLVVYESYAGSGMLCNPEAIFRAALAADDLRHLRHVWVLNDPDANATTVHEFAHEPRVRFVRRGTAAYYRVLATAKYLVNNATFPDPWGKRPEQIYLNTWHGTPIKAMGFDVPGGALNTANVVRNFAAADYLLAPNDDTARMYLSAYRMTNLFRGRLLTTGTPRIDHQFTDGAERTRVLDRLRGVGVDVADNDSIVLYAPTWKGDFYAPTDDIEELHRLVEKVARQLPSSRRLLLKVHQQAYAAASNNAALRRVLVPNDLPANVVLSMTDVLVTDYSSIFVDFLATGRPVVFYAPDLDEYRRTRGWYLPPEQWPGPLCRSVDELVAALIPAGSDPDPRYAAARARYTAREDGTAASRIVDIVFRNAGRADEIAVAEPDGRRSLLINLGGMLANGITMSGLSLLDTIDHSRFDVTAVFPHTNAPERLRLVERINPAARLLPQPASLNGAKLRVRLLAGVSSRLPRRARLLRAGAATLMRREWRRAFGDGVFDHVVDFSGYEPYWLKLLASRPDGSLAVWLHNDIAAELRNPDRPARLRQRMRAVISLYACADRLVSVSETLAEINRRSLAGAAPADRFIHARNTIDVDRIRALASQPADISMPSTGRVFVTVGRLSAEKNHARLIRAFAAVRREHADARLVIVGAGPELDRLRSLAAEIGVTGDIQFAGHLDNPIAVLAAANCFVLSSDYEGQPLALLEALIVGVPIVTTAFESVHDALPPGCGLVVERSDAALADGLRRFLDGKVAAPAFDADGYNPAAVAEFYAALEEHW